MSYEGYEQLLCANGHETVQDVHLVHPDTECHTCKAKFVWFYEVDLTNCCDSSAEKHEAIPVAERLKPDWHKTWCYAHKLKLVEKTPAVVNKCGECGHKTMKTKPTYEIPEGMPKCAAPKPEPCRTCGGAGWLWRHEHPEYREIPMEDLHDDTRYACPACRPGGAA